MYFLPTSSGTLAWDTTQIPNGPYLLYGYATVNDHSESDSATVSVYVLNTIAQPSVSILMVNNDGSTQSLSQSMTLSGTLVRFQITVSNPFAASIGIQFNDIVAQSPTVCSQVCTTASPVTIDTTTLVDGQYDLIAYSMDIYGVQTQAAGNLVELSQGIATLPTVALNSPGQNAVVSGKIGCVINYASSANAVSVQLIVDDGSLVTFTFNQGSSSVLPTTTTIFSLDTLSLINGPHTLTATIIDNNNNVFSTAAVPITVSNTITSPIVSRWTFGLAQYLDIQATTLADGIFVSQTNQYE